MGENVLIRCDYFEGSGLGHLKRCNVLGIKLRQFDLESKIIIDKLIDHKFVDISCPLINFNEDFFNEIKDAENTIDVAKANNCKLIIVDSYRITNKWIITLKDKGFFVVAIDDLGFANFADISINYKPFLKVNNVDYRGLPLLGPKYFLTNTTKLRKKLLTPKKIIFHAGGDCNYSKNSLIYTTAYKAAKNNNLQTTWIYLNNSQRKELSSMIKFDKDDELLIWQPKNSELWSDYDLVFGPASTSLYEAIIQGVLPISFPISKTQTSDRNTWLQIGHSLHLQREEISNHNLITQLINTGIKHYKNLYRNMVEISGDLDGEGADRVAKIIYSLYEHKKINITSEQRFKDKNIIRKCGLQEAQDFLNARNSFKVRQLSTNSEHRISWPEHLNWWFSTPAERFAVFGEHGSADAYFWHKSAIFNGKRYLIGGWFPACENPIFKSAVRLLEWQLKYCANHYHDSTWLATINKSNKAVIALNQRFGFKEACIESTKAAKALFPGTDKNFIILERNNKV